MPKILVVDDELDVREFSRSFFKKRGIEVLTAADGSEALDLIAQGVPDLVLLDVRMDGMSGVDVLRELRRRDIRVKVVMVSGTEDDEIIRESASLGSLGFIHKPLVLEELQRVVFSHITP
ncbi:MAG: response regulator [Candidatus Omnitrophica bacterium]|nr:response regulator [Candidatus Omnitrophota bacterium]